MEQEQNLAQKIESVIPEKHRKWIDVYMIIAITMVMVVMVYFVYNAYELVNDPCAVCMAEEGTNCYRTVVNVGHEVVVPIEPLPDVID